MTNEWKKIIFSSGWILIVCLLFTNASFINLWIIICPYILGFLLMKNSFAELLLTSFWLGFSIASFLNLPPFGFIWWLIAIPSCIIYNIYRDKQKIDMIEEEKFQKLTNPKE